MAGGLSEVGGVTVDCGCPVCHRGRMSRVVTLPPVGSLLAVTLGNHEHAHLGGPRLAKFHSDEAAHLERQYASGGFTPIRRWLAGWPLAAVAPVAAIAFTHAAPHAQISGPRDLDDLALAGYESTPLADMASTGPLGALLWARTTPAERGFAFLRALHHGCKVAVFGHDIVREGHLVEHEPLLCISSSFGCYRDAGQCSALQGGGEGPWGRVARPERALTRLVLLLDVLV
jgi:hypothetical protein